MIVFLRARGLSLSTVVVVMILIALTQAGITYSVDQGPLREIEPRYLPAILAALSVARHAVRLALLLLLVTLWALNRRHGLLRTIIVANAYFTVILLLDAIALVGVLGGFRQAAEALLIDAALMCISNILVFSVWYWSIDSPEMENEVPGEGQAAFLFPQRSLPAYERWSPHYPDYLFIAFTTSFAFSPTDALPLTRTAKMLMLLQASISVVIVLGIAGGAINAVVGG